jgi:general stress protein 26
MASQTERDQAIQKLAELIGKVRIAMLTTITEDGSLRSRPVITRNARSDGDLWVITRRESAKVHQVNKNQWVSLGYASPADNIYVSVSGTAEVVSDPKKAEEVWDPSYRNWLPGGPTDPDLALIRVRVAQAEYWNAPPQTWPLLVGFVTLGDEQRDDPTYHARINFQTDG